MRYETKIYTHGFQQFETIRSFGDNIYTVKVTINEAERDQNNLLENMAEFNDKSRPRSEEVKKKKKILMKVHMLLLKVDNYMKQKYIHMVFNNLKQKDLLVIIFIPVKLL